METIKVKKESGLMLCSGLIDLAFKKQYKPHQDKVKGFCQYMFI